jgi:muramoyltetrapeptide carboxypeptidase
MKRNSQKRRVGIWSGASPAKKSEIRSGLKKLAEMGIEFTANASNLKAASRSWSKERPFLAGPDEQKVSALLKLLIDPNFQDILCVRGGYGSVRLIKALDAVEIPANSKRIWGFSDMTSLQNYLYFRAKMPWVHSPMLTSNAFFKASGLEKTQWTLGNKNHFVVKLLSKKIPAKLPAKALILGGNLTCLASLAATSTQFFPKEDFVLFLEDVSEKAYRLDRMLTLLSHVDFFKNCKALFLGYFTDCPKWKGVFQAWSEEHQIPVYAGLPAGHDRPNLALPLGVKIDIKKQGKNFGSAELHFPKILIGC